MLHESDTFCWIEGDMLCAELPALIFFSDSFEPMWKQNNSFTKHSESGDVICIPKPKATAIIRIGRGWGRNGKDYYYLYLPPDTVRKLIKRPTKRLYERTWMTCLEDKVLNKKWCFEWKDGRIVLVKNKVI